MTPAELEALKRRLRERKANYVDQYSVGNTEGRYVTEAFDFDALCAEIDAFAAEFKT